MFSFTLKLTATLLQKLAPFYMSNVKQNNGMMEWNNTPSTVAIMVMFRGGSRTAATSKMERFVIIVNG